MKKAVVIKILLMLMTAVMFFDFAVCAEEKDFETAADRAYQSISFGAVMDFVVQEIQKAFVPSLPLFSALLGMIFICAVINIFGVNFDRFDIGEYISALCFSAFLFNIIKSLCENISSFVEKIKSLSTVLLPGVISASFSDGAVSAQTSATGTAISLYLIEFLVSSIVIPCAKILFVFATVSVIVSNTLDLRAISSSLRTFAVIFTSLLMTANVTIIHLQCVVARATDNVAARAVRFAATNFVPIVGNMLGESVKSVSESIKAVGNVTGVLGVCTVLYAALPPIIACLVFKIELNICICVAKTLGCTKQGMLLSDVGGILNVLNGGLVASAVGFSLVICLVTKVI